MHEAFLVYTAPPATPGICLQAHGTQRMLPDTHESWLKADYHRVGIPKSLSGLDRANWVQAQGPQPLLVDQRVASIVQCEEEVMRIEQAMEGVPEPCQGPAIRAVVTAQLTACTRQWLIDFQDAGYETDHTITALSDR